MAEQFKHLTCPVLVVRLAVAELRGDELADEVREQLLTLYHRAQPAGMVIDFQGVTYLSSAGFRPLLSLQRAVRERGGRLVLCNLDPNVAEVFSVMRLIGGGVSRATFEVQPDVPAAAASLYRPAEG
jgi:anti-anti-sigma factor